jgi:hypothetical protein
MQFVKHKKSFDKTKWHPWFAWKPVYVATSRRVHRGAWTTWTDTYAWLQWVERQVWAGTYYRVPPKEAEQ